LEIASLGNGQVVHKPHVAFGNCAKPRGNLNYDVLLGTLREIKVFGSLIMSVALIFLKMWLSRINSMFSCEVPQEHTGARSTWNPSVCACPLRLARYNNKYRHT
jgi:hypothetical protein